MRASAIEDTLRGIYARW